ncbi:ATP-binding protein [Rhodococcus sp. NPDC127528]|uniref:ATP-binding protein n=1 Tax=unclassified Rhodococcus (in: high G+C Gram-positive bacteria) TaxID=192944 RepID=UPI003631BEB7
MSSAVRERVGNLPHELTNFVGRRRELAEVRRLLSESRLVTLTGMGGVGKTRLALRVAANLQEDFEDGVWLVELGALAEPHLLADTVAAALGLRERLARSPLPLLVDFLVGRRALIVLDNCEHLVAEVAEFTKAVLSACPEVQILATSREALGADGEAVLRVPPLTVPDPDTAASLRGLSRYEGVVMFEARARSAVPGFSLTVDNQDTVAEICQRLEGLPLAIELAAARLRALSLKQILVRLTDRYRLLTAGNRVAPSRQQTLRLCIDWSHDLLGERERTLWRRLAVFAGGFELDAAAEVSGFTDGELVDVLASLLDKSILIREEAGEVARYRMLETIREYGLEKLTEAGESALLRQRHHDWCVRLTLQADAEWIGKRQLDWIARFDRTRADLRGALEFSVTAAAEPDAALHMIAGIYPYWVSRGLYSEGRYWIERALARADGAPAASRVTVLCLGSMLALMQGDVQAAQVWTDVALPLAESEDDPAVSAFAVSANGYLATFAGDFARATECFEESLLTLRTEGGLLPRVGTLVGLAMACGLSGDSARAIACHEEVIALTASHGESMYRSYSLSMLGLAVWERGDTKRAARLIEEAMRLTRLVDDPLGLAMCLEILGWLAADRPERAAVLMGASAWVGEAAGSPTIVVRDLFGHHDRIVRESTDALGQKAFEAAFARGRDLGGDAAIAYALGDQTSAEPRASGPSVRLTRRQREIAELVAQGLTNKAIAQQLVISQRTAEGHVENVLTKLGFTTRAQIAAWVVAGAGQETTTAS